MYFEVLFELRVCFLTETFYTVIAIFKTISFLFQEDIGIETDEEYGAVIPST